MKKSILSISLLYTISFGFGLDSLTNIANNIGESFSNINFNNNTSINVDYECKQQFENYDFNWAGILKVASLYGLSNSGTIISLLNSNQNSSKQISQEDFKNFANTIAKNYLWIPLEIEKIYGEQIYKDRVKNGDVVLRNTKNSKYKKLYKKLDNFIDEFNAYTKTLENSYPYDIKVYILSAEKKAESAPYGYVFISEDYIKNDMYKTILAHELSHISKRHATKEIQFRLVNMYSSITDITLLIQDMQNVDVASKMVYGDLGLKVIQKSFELYSQEQELEADACGLKILNTIAPNETKINIQKFIKNINEGYHYNDQVSNKDFKEHPDKEVRINHINNLANKL